MGTPRSQPLSDVPRPFVCLHVPPAAANVVFQLTCGCVECVPEHDPEVFVRVVGGRIAGDDDFSRGRRDVDAHGEEVALGPMSMRDVDRHVPPDDPVVKALEPRGPLADCVFDCGRWGHAPERNLQGELHDLWLVQTVCQ